MSLKPLTILLIEDDLVTAMDIREILEEAAHIVVTARNYQEALSALSKYHFDIALVDISLANSLADGITTARELLAKHKMALVYLTAHSEPQTFKAVRDTKPVAYLLKPFLHNELTGRVEMAYQNWQSGLQDTAIFLSGSLFLPVNKGGYKKVNLADIVYLQADGSYTKVYVTTQVSYLHISASLGHLTQYFPENEFYRLSRSYLINLFYLDRIENGHLFLSEFAGSFPIPAGSQKEIMNMFNIVRTKREHK